MATVFELPEELDLSEADQSQHDDVAVCDVLAEPTASDEQEAMASETEEEASTEESATAETTADKPPVTISWRPPFEMVNIIECITDAEHECCAAEELMDDLKEQLKDAKKHYETCVKRLRTFARELDRNDKPVTKSTAMESPDTDPCADPSLPAAIIESPESGTPEVPVDDSWRSVLLTEVGINLIRGLGAKKLEALCDLCPTLGDFEDLRARVGKDAATLPELMPKGIGQQACDAIEETVLNWLAKWNESAQAALCNDPPPKSTETNVSGETTEAVQITETEDAFANL